MKAQEEIMINKYHVALEVPKFGACFKGMMIAYEEKFSRLCEDLGIQNTKTDFELDTIGST